MKNIILFFLCLTFVSCASTTAKNKSKPEDQIDNYAQFIDRMDIKKTN